MAPRVRATLMVTAHFEGRDDAVLCKTKDISEFGLFLETSYVPKPFCRVNLSLLDSESGDAVELVGAVMRILRNDDQGGSEGLGIHIDYPPPLWVALVERYVNKGHKKKSTTMLPAKRKRILVVADDDHQRGALALYVRSGWDVRFANDLSGAKLAMAETELDAVIAEHDLADRKWSAILEAARSSQPNAFRIIRTRLPKNVPPADLDQLAPDGLVHRLVDQGADLEAVLDELGAEASYVL